MAQELMVIAAHDFKSRGVEMKAGESRWLPYDAACVLASHGRVNVPRPQPEKPASAENQPKP